MTKQEFEKEYSRLEKAFPQSFNIQERKDLFARTVGPLRAFWWRSLVDRMILEANPKFNILEAVRAEQNAEHSVKRTAELCRKVDAGLAHISDQGALNAFKQFGAQSFAEAVLKNKKSS